MKIYVEHDICTTCGGDGEVEVGETSSKEFPTGWTIRQPCYACDGSGKRGFINLPDEWYNLVEVSKGDNDAKDV